MHVEGVPMGSEALKNLKKTGVLDENHRFSDHGDYWCDPEEPKHLRKMFGPQKLPNCSEARLSSYFYSLTTKIPANIASHASTADRTNY